MANEQLWAPWRLEYIVAGKDDAEPCSPDALLPGAEAECFLCRAMVSGDERRRGIIHRGTDTITLLNRYPYNNGHVLIAPARHVCRLDELGEEVAAEISRQITRMTVLLEKVMSPQGFNIGLNLGRAAGAGLPGHLHWHIVPRWIGDTNFMPTIAGVNTIPQSLEALWDLLNEALMVLHKGENYVKME